MPTILVYSPSTSKSGQDESVDVCPMNRHTCREEGVGEVCQFVQMVKCVHYIICCCHTWHFVLPVSDCVGQQFPVGHAWLFAVPFAYLYVRI